MVGGVAFCNAVVIGRSDSDNSRHRSRRSSTCLLKERRSRFAISDNRVFRLADTRTNIVALGSVIPTET